MKPAPFVIERQQDDHKIAYVFRFRRPLSEMSGLLRDRVLLMIADELEIEAIRLRDGESNGA